MKDKLKSESAKFMLIGVRDGGAGGAIAPPFFGQFEISFGHFVELAIVMRMEGDRRMMGKGLAFE